MREKFEHYRGDLALLLVTLIWGTTFTLTKLALQEITPMLFLAMRFIIGFILLSLFFGKRLLKMDRKVLVAGLVVGGILFFGYSTQTLGMQDPNTTASKAAFITGMSVIFTPLLSVVFLRQKPTFYALLGALVAFIGLALLSVDFNDVFSSGISWGDLLVLACAVAFAGHIVAVGKFTSQVDVGAFTTWQIGVVGLLCTVTGLATEPLPTNLSPSFWWGLLYMGGVATAGTLMLQNWAQKYATPTRTAVIFTMEPVFAGMFAMIFLGETLSRQNMFGAALILAGLLLAELRPEPELVSTVD